MLRTLSLGYLTLHCVLFGVMKCEEEVCSASKGCSSSSSGNVLPLVNDSSGVVYGSSSCTVKEGKEEAFAAYLAKEDLVRKARNWDGNLYYYALQDVNNPRSYRWFEKWASIPQVMNWLNNYGKAAFEKPELDDILEGADSKNGKSGMTIDGVFHELVSPDESKNVLNTIEKCDALYDWTVDTPTFFGGNNGVGQRMSSVNSLDNGVVSSYRVAYNVPIGRNALWKAFDNYFEFQATNMEHPNTKHHSGPHNQVGEIVEFTYEDNKYGFEKAYEKLALKDDENYVWKVDCVPLDLHPLFEKYLYTARIYPDNYNIEYPNGGSLLVTDMEFSFRDNVSISVREDILSHGKYNSAYYGKYIYDFAFTKVGTHVPYDFDVNVPTEWLFEYLSDWTNTKWVLASVPETLNMLQSDIRELGTTSGMKLLERVSESRQLDENTFLFEYQVMNGGMPLRDTLTLTKKLGGRRTNIKGKLTIYPKPQEKEMYLEMYKPVIQAAVDNWPQVLVDEYKASK